MVMRRLWLLFSQAVTVALAVFFVVAALKPQWLARAPSTSGSVVAVQTAPALPPRADALQPSTATGLSASAKRASPAVVSIAASKAPARNAQMDDPWFRFFFGDRAQQSQRAMVGLGSGVIVSQDGYLLTNNHVIEGADDIEVQLPDGRSVTAKLIGTDPESDVAVLKIQLDRLPVITFGQVESLQVGDAVLAIGNPFGVGQTVTSGIVSALNRNHLGINTAIYSRSGGNLGIGFAIPANTAKLVMDSLVKDGTVTRGWIGVEPRDLTPEIASSLKLPIKQGVLITGVLQDGPAAKGGVQPGDVVTKVGDEPITTTSQLLNAVAALKPQDDARIGVQRGDREVDLKVRVMQRPKARQAAQ